MIFCFLCKFRNSTDLEMFFWENIFSWFIWIIIFRSFAKVLFHHIQKIIVLSLIYSWIFDNQTTIFMKRVCDLFAIRLINCWVRKKARNIYNWDFSKSTSKHNIFRKFYQHFNNFYIYYKIFITSYHQFYVAAYYTKWH